MRPSGLERRAKVASSNCVYSSCVYMDIGAESGQEPSAPAADIARRSAGSETTFDTSGGNRYEGATLVRWCRCQWNLRLVRMSAPSQC